MPKIRSFWIPALAALGWLVLAVAANAQETHVLYPCAKLVTDVLRSYSEDLVAEVANCEENRLASGSPADCASDPTVLAAVGNIARDLERQVEKIKTNSGALKCTVETERALCPLESRNADILIANVTGETPGTTIRARLLALVADLFVTPYDGCARPVGTVAIGVRDCAARIGDFAAARGEELEQCFFSCERANLGDADYCVSLGSGNPADQGVIDCVVKKTGDLGGIATKCDDAKVLALGCPLGARTVADLVEALAERLSSFAQELSYGVFHSSCRTSPPVVPVPLTPAKVTLSPSLTQKEVSCGQVLDAEFFGPDDTVQFDEDLNCGPASEADAVDGILNGIVVARSKVKINGRTQTRSIKGPTRSSLRTGAGIKLAPGVNKVEISGFKSIERFAVGIEDSGDNRVVRVSNTTVFRNVEAGIRLGAKKALVKKVKADRNGIGLQISGDASRIDGSQVLRSEQQRISALAPWSPGIGILLAATDANGDGRAVQLQTTTVEGNVIGLVVVGSSNRIEKLKIRDSVVSSVGGAPFGGDGVWLAGTGNRFDSNSVKTSAGIGIVVSGDGNLVASNHSDENLGAGYRVSGTGNTVENNGSGSPTDNGNQGDGFVVTGPDNRLDSNRAEANAGNGYVIQSPTALFKGNRAEGNAGMGFEVSASGVGLESNSAAVNGGAEFAIAPSNSDLTGNRANGSGFSFDASGATID